MGIVSYHENMQRGSRDFPASYYHVDRKHPRYQMMAHWHNDFEVIRVLSGSLKLKLNGKPVELKKGEGIFVPGNIMHTAEAFDCVYECIVFSKAIFGASVRCKNASASFGFARYKDCEDVNKLFEAFEKKYEGYEFVAISLIYKLSYGMLDKEKTEKLADDKAMYKIRPAIAIIEEEYGNKITLDILASACGISQNYFSRRFKEITGQTPFEYLRVYRIETACEMLLGGGESVTDVCFKCGFNDLSYFINVFKKHIGISPKVYAKAHKG